MPTRLNSLSIHRPTSNAIPRRDRSPCTFHTVHTYIYTTLHGLHSHSSSIQQLAIMIDNSPQCSTTTPSCSPTSIRFLNLTLPEQDHLPRLNFSPQAVKTLLGFASTHQLSSYNRPTASELLSLMNGFSSSNTLDSVAPKTLNILAQRLVMAIDRRVAKIITAEKWLRVGNAVVWPKWTEDWMADDWSGTVVSPGSGLGYEGRKIVEKRHSLGAVRLGHEVERSIVEMRKVKPKECDVLPLPSKEDVALKQMEKMVIKQEDQLPGEVPSSSSPSHQELDHLIRKALDIFYILSKSTATPSKNVEEVPASISSCGPIVPVSSNLEDASSSDTEKGSNTSSGYSSDRSTPDDGEYTPSPRPRTPINNDDPPLSAPPNPPTSKPRIDAVASQDPHLDDPKPVAITGTRISTLTDRLQFAVEWDDGVGTWQDAKDVVKECPELVKKWEWDSRKAV